MPAIFFDKLEAMPRLEASGLPSSQAKALTETIHEATEASVATRTDLELMEGRLHSEITGVERRLRLDMTGLEGGLRLAISEMKSALQTEMARSSRWIIGTVITVSIASGVVQHFWK